MKFLSVLYWTALSLVVLGSIAGLFTGYGGGDARPFYGLVLCGSISLGFVSLGLWAALDSGEGFLFVVGLGLAGLVMTVACIANCHRSVYLQVDQGHTGVLIKDGKVQPERFGPGLYWRSPFLKARQHRTDPAEAVVRVTARSADGSKTHVVLFVAYQIRGEKLDEVVLSPAASIDAVVRDVIEDEVQRHLVGFKDTDLKAQRFDLERRVSQSATEKLEKRCIRLIRLGVGDMVGE